MKNLSISSQLAIMLTLFAFIQASYIKIDQNLFQQNYQKNPIHSLTPTTSKKDSDLMQSSQKASNFSIDKPQLAQGLSDKMRSNGIQMNITKQTNQTKNQRILTIIAIQSQFQNVSNITYNQNQTSITQSIVNSTSTSNSNLGSSSTFGDFNNLIIPSLSDLNSPAFQAISITRSTSPQSINSPNSANLINQVNTYNNNDFTGIVLYSQIPTTLAQEQFILVKGQISQQYLAITNSNNYLTQNFNFIFICTQTGNKFYFQTSLYDTNKFKIQVQVPPVGNYQISMFLGVSGNFSITIYKVVSNMPSALIIDNQTNSNISNLLKNEQLFNIQIINNDLYVQFFSSNFEYLQKNQSSKAYPIYRLQFSQQNINSSFRFNFSNVSNPKVVLYLANFNDSDLFLIPYAKFAYFTNALTTLNVSIGVSSTPSISGAQRFYSFYQLQQFEAIQHQFLEIKDNLLAFYQTPPCYLITGQNMKVQGQAKSPLQNSMVVLSPTKTFFEYPLDNLIKSNQTLTINSQVNLTFLINNQGTYIVEINHVDGYAVLNQPVYVGKNKYPLYPDFNDLNSPFVPNNSLIVYPDLEKQKLNLLNLINLKRRQFNQSDLYLDDTLNTLAQTHTDDMANKNYVSHTTPEGLGPSQRAAQLGFYSQLSQNIGVNRNITDAHYRFCRSNIHLRNIVNSDWTRIGLGLKLGQNNNYYITQQFSVRDLVKYPLTDTEISLMQQKIINFFINASIYLKSQNKNLSSTLKTFQNTLLTNPKANLGDYLKQYSRWTYTSLSISYTTNYMNIIQQQIGILPTSSTYTQIGMSMQYQNGLLVMYFAFVS